MRESGDNVLTRRNRVLLVVMWLRSYPTYRLLANMFGVSVSYVEKEIQRTIPVFDNTLTQYLRWPGIQEWQQMRNHWHGFVDAVGTIDGTSYEIYMPGIN